MEISIIIPTYKPQHYIWDCLQSLAHQSFDRNSFEIIIILNGCHEPYFSQISAYIQEKMPNHFVKLIQTNEGGVSNARNIGLNIMKGKYVTFIDDDDLVSETFLEELHQQASPNVISLCYPYAFDDGKIEIQKTYRKTILFEKYANHKLLRYEKCRQFFSGPCMKLIPASFIGDRRFNVNFKNGEDSLFMFLISDKFQYVNLTSKNAIYYRRLRNNSAQFAKRRPREIINNQFRMLLEYFKIYFDNFKNYRLLFFVTRILGTFKATLYSIFK